MNKPTVSYADTTRLFLVQHAGLPCIQRATMLKCHISCARKKGQRKGNPVVRRVRAKLQTSAVRWLGYRTGGDDALTDRLREDCQH